MATSNRPSRRTGSRSRAPHPAKSAHSARNPGPPATDWDHVADWYDHLVGDEGSEYQRKVVIPGVLELLDLPLSTRNATTPPPTPGLRVLDIGCGQGVLCRALAHRGCNVVGIDAAPSLIDAARTRQETDPVAHTSIRYIVGDAAHLDKVEAIESASFDAITCILAIQNIAVLSPVWRGCANLLAPSGRLIVVMMHPCFRVPKASQWGWDAQAAPSSTSSSALSSKPSVKAKPDRSGRDRPPTSTNSNQVPRAGTEYRRIDRYLSSAKTPIQMHPGSDPTITTWHFHRPLQAYINTLAEAGFAIDHLDEWPSHKRSDPTDPKAPAQDLARREIPMFLALRARRVNENP